MATIVDIRNAASVRGVRAQSTPVRGPADILIFTGVQYERWAERKPRQSAERTRDRLDLED